MKGEGEMSEMKPVTRVISRETAERWGLPGEGHMADLPKCLVCAGPVEWVTDPEAGWWSHWEQPADDHEITVEPHPNDGKAIFIKAEHIETHRSAEEWSLIFTDPEESQTWEVAFWTDHMGEVDTWHDSREIVLTKVQRTQVVRYEWRTVRASGV
jgi:hypothetical protein